MGCKVERNNPWVGVKIVNARLVLVRNFENAFLLLLNPARSTHVKCKQNSVVHDEKLRPSSGPIPKSVLPFLIGKHY